MRDEERIEFINGYLLGRIGFHFNKAIEDDRRASAIRNYQMDRRKT